MLSRSILVSCLCVLLFNELAFCEDDDEDDDDPYTSRDPSKREPSPCEGAVSCSVLSFWAKPRPGLGGRKKLTKGGGVGGDGNNKAHTMHAHMHTTHTHTHTHKQTHNLRMQRFQFEFWHLHNFFVDFGFSFEITLSTLSRIRHPRIQHAMCPLLELVL